MPPEIASEWPWNDDDETDVFFSDSLLLPWKEALNSRIETVEREHEPRFETLD
jgi:hypothetical protein